MANITAKSDTPMAAAVGKRGGYWETSWYIAVVNTKTVAPSTPGTTSGSVTFSMVRRRLAPTTCEASSSAGSIDFITAPIITKATEPSNSAITHAMPHGEL